MSSARGSPASSRRSPGCDRPLLPPYPPRPKGGNGAIPEIEVEPRPEVGSVSDSYDNALAETINGLFKAEAIHRRGPWRSIVAVEYATLEWVDWYNHRRVLAPIGNVPPAEAEARYHTQVGDQAMAA